MKKNQSKLEELKGKNPFTVPTGYMEGLNAQIMSQLPEKERKAKTVSMMDHVRPWLYMAAVFAGLLLFFKVIIGIPGLEKKSNDLIVQTEVPNDAYSAIEAEEDIEYLEFIESQYTDYILAEEVGFYE